MDFSKLTLSDKVIGGSGIALLIFSFLPWYGIDTAFGSASRNGWDYFLFGIIPVLLAVAIVAVVAITRFGDNVKLPELPISWGLAILIAAGLAAFLVVIKLLIGDKASIITLDRKYGIFLAALASLGLVGGAYLRFREEGGATTQRRSGSGSGGGGGPSTPF